VTVLSISGHEVFFGRAFVRVTGGDTRISARLKRRSPRFLFLLAARDLGRLFVRSRLVVGPVGATSHFGATEFRGEVVGVVAPQFGRALLWVAPVSSAFGRDRRSAIE